MFERRHSITTFIFLLFCLGMITFSLSGNWDTGDFVGQKNDIEGPSRLSESYFKDANYYILKDFRPSFFLFSNVLTINQVSSRVNLLGPSGGLYTNDGREIKYEAKQGIFRQKEEKLHLKGNVKMELKESLISADSLDYDVRKDEIFTSGNVVSSSLSKENDEIEMRGDKAFFWPKKRQSKYFGNVEGFIKRKRAYEEGIKFKSNIIHLNIPKSLVGLVGNISFKKQRLKAYGRRGEIYLENYSKRLKYFVLYDDVKVVEKVSAGGRVFERKAFSEKLEGIMSEDQIILTGYPKVFQLKDVIKGNRIVLRENNEVVEVDDANTIFKLK